MWLGKCYGIRRFNGTQISMKSIDFFDSIEDAADFFDSIKDAVVDEIDELVEEGG